MANAPWYVRNSTLHRDLETLPIADMIKHTTQKQFEAITSHPNNLLREATTYNAEEIKIHRRPKSTLLP